MIKIEKIFKHFKLKKNPNCEGTSVKIKLKEKQKLFLLKMTTPKKQRNGEMGP